MDVEDYVVDYAQVHVSINVKDALDVAMVAHLVLVDVEETVKAVVLEHVPMDVDLDVLMDAVQDVHLTAEETALDVRNLVPVLV